MPRRRRLRVALGGVLAVTVGTITACGGASDPAPLPQQPPDRRAEIPAETQREVRDVFHRLPRFCGRDPADRAEEATLERTTARFIGFYRRYPADRFRLAIDDESGSMLSALLVLRAELAALQQRSFLAAG
jgi:hypothetical protein